MLEWFLNTIGYNDREVLAHLDRVTLSFQRPGVFWLGMALLPLIGWWVWTRQARNLGPVSKGLLAALTGTRVAIAGLLAATLASPILKLDHRVERRPLLAVLVDHSASMRLPAGPFENAAVTGKLAAATGLIPPPDPRPAPDTTAAVPASTATAAAGPTLSPEAAETLRQISRFDLARAIVQQSGPLWTELAQTHDVRFYQSAVSLQPLTLENERPEYPALDESVSFPATHLGDTIGKVLEEAAGRPVAGLLLL
ncbi:MAG: hypothetical protein ACKO3P_15000, partial [Planctomycetaceae bacterium]